MTRGETLADAIDALLPQTQCGKCGFPGCRPYAEALVDRAAAINQCPPGGDALAHELAALLGVAPQPLDPAFGTHRPPAVAVIDESACIGCRLCIAACPVDAIVGAPKLMHTVLAGECTGCELCLAPCPVDCIRMELREPSWSGESKRLAAARARRRFDARKSRLLKEQQAREARLAAARESAAETRKRAAIRRALARAHVRLQQRGQ
ncbi:MAG TPA: RnfABCDGE type electron transport complex subunit B [Burkholderiales bacterium]|nr:RnfABCDGE type electron transport complex subunit B [Burkholderiales bacterium]